MRGKIVLLPFPFIDLASAKLRPALVLYEGKLDVVVAFISSKIPSELSKTDVLVIKDDPDFGKTGLKVGSVIKLDKIATVFKDLVVGELGELSDGVQAGVSQKLQRAIEN
jgi:mRNA interferase MazF